MDEIIPAALVAEWCGATIEREHFSRRSWLIAFRQLTQLRDLLTENTLPNDVFRVPVSQIYERAAELLEYSENTLRAYVRNIRAYEDWQLLQWAADGVTMEHIKAANLLDGKMPPRDVLNRAVEFGGTSGGRIMSPDEMTAFALGSSNTSYYSDARVERQFNFLLRLGSGLGEREGEFRADVEGLRMKYFAD